MSKDAPWAQHITEQNDKIAERLYEADAETVASFGKQPLDAETGEAQARIPEPEQEEIHAILRTSLVGTLGMLTGEAKKRGLSSAKTLNVMYNVVKEANKMGLPPEAIHKVLSAGLASMPIEVLPRQMVKDMVADERRYQRIDGGEENA